MEKLLERYLKSYHNLENIYIDYYNVDGAGCTVRYYIDEGRHYRQTTSINIWDMLVFLHELNA